MCICDWVYKKQKYIYAIVACIAIGATAYYFYNRNYTQEPVSLISEADKCKTELKSLYYFVDYILIRERPDTEPAKDECQAEKKENRKILNECLNMWHIGAECQKNCTITCVDINDYFKKYQYEVTYRATTQTLKRIYSEDES